MKRVVKGVYFWTMGISVTAVLWLACAWRHALMLLKGGPDDGRTVHQIATLWGRAMFAFMPGWRVTIEGRENMPPDGQPMVIVANHESMSDIWAMYYLGMQFRWMAKREAFAVPMVGNAMTWSRYVPVDRRSRESGAEAMRQSARRLDQGLSMFFFPEGTRSDEGQVKAFKLGAFKLARDSQVPILPIAIHGAGGLFPRGSGWPGDHVHVRVRVLPPIPPPPPDTQDVTAYAEMIRKEIISAHASIS